jgi:mannosyltransferase OCH1-like enzyme
MLDIAWASWSDGQVRILQKSTVLEYLDEEELANRFMEMTSHQTASDAVRLGVLSRYGGAAGLV